MAALSQFLAIERPDSRVSLARSDSTYHSFQDIELYEPEVSEVPQKPLVPSSNLKTKATTACSPPSSSLPKGNRPPLAREMRRQDSGYESMLGRDSFSSPDRGTSATSLSSSNAPGRRRTRPSSRRPARSSGTGTQFSKTTSRSVSPTSGYQSSQSQSQQEITYFHFPQPEFTSEPEEIQPSILDQKSRDFVTEMSVAYRLPPQTTHYWTSDQTRRLEYAAIDAASKGVRGWVMRHVVPECLVPTSKRRVGFEDDRGSVIRYRLDLETDDGAEKADSDARRGWRTWFSIRQR
ncbi:hypothetical protein QBC35DRAFT_474569 [Podospora australis]|uniref:Uncharacterized protein n=1 Tax=Podospora australis TaxID=1536484 RepID=A0AAN6WSN2_9PEZI|nr:hypothetical protein QBC35DRAFT_474569 [Podospora australis]